MHFNNPALFTPSPTLKVDNTSQLFMYLNYLCTVDTDDFTTFVFNLPTSFVSG